MSRHPVDIEFSVVSGAREDLLFDCLASLYEVMHGSTYSWAVTATCNSPGTKLAEQLHAKFPTIQTVENAVARGFAANHNTILNSSSARYVWLLNDDLIILPEAIGRITEYMDAKGNERVGAVSPRLLNPDGTLQPSTYSFPSMPQTLLAHSGLREHPMTTGLLRLVAPIVRARKGSSRFWAHDETIEVDTLRGACVAMRMSAVRQVGLMSEASIVGGEETEWHRRLKDHGWKVVFFADASVIHYGSQTVGGDSAKLPPEYLKGALNFFRTNRRNSTYTFFCRSLEALFAVRKVTARIRRDANGLELARRYAAVTNEAMRSR